MNNEAFFDEGAAADPDIAAMFAMALPDVKLNDDDCALVINLEEPADGIIRNPEVVHGSVTIVPVGTDYWHHGITVKLIKRATAGDYEIDDVELDVNRRFNPFRDTTLIQPFELNGRSIVNGTFVVINPPVSVRYFVQALMKTRDDDELLAEREISVAIMTEIDPEALNPVFELKADIQAVLAVDLVSPTSIIDIRNVVHSEVRYSVAPSPFVMHRTVIIDLHQVLTKVQVFDDGRDVIGDVVVWTRCFKLDVDEFDYTRGHENFVFDLEALGIVPTIELGEAFTIKYFLRMTVEWEDEEDITVLAEKELTFY